MTAHAAPGFWGAGVDRAQRNDGRADVVRLDLLAERLRDHAHGEYLVAE
jgi:hypothetical protein